MWIKSPTHVLACIKERLHHLHNCLLKSKVEISKSYTKVEWRDDLRKVLRRAGGEYKPTVFLFSDTQIKDEGFVEDINNILNSGEVPNMFPQDEKMQVGWSVDQLDVGWLVR